MRINEIADAEEQIALWRLVSDNVWSALHTQAEEQAKQRAAAEQQRKLKPKRGRKGSVTQTPLTTSRFKRQSYLICKPTLHDHKNRA